MVWDIIATDRQVGITSRAWPALMACLLLGDETKVTRIDALGCQIPLFYDRIHLVGWPYPPGDFGLWQLVICFGF